MAHSSLAKLYIGDNPNYSNSSYRTGKNLIVLHHMAGILTPQQCNNALRSRRGSIHYAIGNDGTIGWGIDENEVAWHAGNWPINQRSIGIEISDSAIGGDWPISNAALNSTIRVVADIAKRNNMGKLVNGKNIGYHSMYAATTCPGPDVKGKFQYIIDEANKINGGGPAPTPTPTPTPKDKFLPAKGYWGPGDNDKRVGQIASFMRRVFPAYTSAKALGPYYGPYLKSSILQFQKRTGMSRVDCDGCVGPLTLAKLRSYGAPF